MTQGPSSLVARSTGGVARQVDWAWQVALYMGLSSAGAGAYVVWQAAGLLIPSWTTAGRAGAVSGIVLVILGALLILMDLGRRTRFYRAAYRPRASWESRGFLLILAFVLLGGTQIGCWAVGLELWAAPLSIPMTLLALALLPYAALLLRGMSVFALWTSPLQLALIPASGLLAGCAVLTLDPLGSLTLLHFQRLSAALLVLIALEAVLLVALLWRTQGAGKAGAASVQALLGGTLSRHFWIGAIMLGLVIPFLIALPVGWGVIDAGMLRLAGAAALTGHLLFRYSVLAAAHRPTELTFRGAGPWGGSR